MNCELEDKNNTFLGHDLHHGDRKWKWCWSQTCSTQSLNRRRWAERDLPLSPRYIALVSSCIMDMASVVLASGIHAPLKGWFLYELLQGLTYSKYAWSLFWFDWIKCLCQLMFWISSCSPVWGTLFGSLKLEEGGHWESIFKGDTRSQSSLSAP